MEILELIDLVGAFLDGHAASQGSGGTLAGILGISLGGAGGFSFHRAAATYVDPDHPLAYGKSTPAEPIPKSHHDPRIDALWRGEQPTTLADIAEAARESGAIK